MERMMTSMCHRWVVHCLPALLLLALATLPACSRVVSNAAGDMADNLSQAIANNDDPDTVREGAAAYLLMLDGMIHGDPENEDLLAKAATLYSTYGTAFVQDPERSRKLSTRALDYAERAVCASDTDDCGLRRVEFDLFEARIQALDEDDVALFFTLGSAWAGWIQAHKGDLEAVAELSRVETIMRRMVALDETYQQGNAHLYLGSFAILTPPALGGQPEVARKHFERAIALSEGKNLMAKVIYAQQYARMLYDQTLHDRLLTEVLAADPYVTDMVLQNILAQERARALMASGEEYF